MATNNTILIQDLVQWYEGQLLYPQHYQQMHIRLEMQMLYYLSISCPWYWGVRSYTIDPALLAAGKISLTHIDAITPDGTPIQTGGISSSTLSLDISSLKDRITSEPLTIYLAVIARQTEVSALMGESARYVSVQSSPVPDMNTGDGAMSIPLLAVRAFLIAENSLPSHYSGFPLAKVQFINNMFTLVDFMPPAIMLFALPALQARLAQLIKTMRDQVNYFSERIQNLKMRDIAPIFNFYSQIYDVLVTRLPPIEGVSQTKEVHPFTVYKELLSLSGILCIASPGTIPPVFPPYDHDNLFKCFDAVFSFIETIITSLKAPAVPVAFHIDHNIFGLTIKPEWLTTSTLTIGIRASEGQLVSNVVQWIKGAIICSASFVQSVRERRILGLERTLIEQMPQMGLVISTHQILASLIVNPEYIKEGEPLMIFNPSGIPETQPAEITLYVPS